MNEISWAACLRLGVTAAAVYLICAGRGMLAALLDALAPLLIGGGVACVVNIPMAALERRLFPGGGRRGRMACLTLSLAAVGAAALWLAGVILPEALQCVTLLMNCLPVLLTRLTSLLQGPGAAWLASAGLPEWQQLAEHALNLAMEGALGWLGTAADALSALTAGAADLLLSLIFAVYLLVDKERLGAQLTRLGGGLLGEIPLRRFRRALAALNDAVRAYVLGSGAEALILGCLCLIGMLLLRLPGALPISAMAGVTALLPLIGAPIAAIVGAVLLLPEGASAAVTFAAFFLLLQQAESSLIGPRVVGASLGLSPVWTLAAMLLGGGLGGIAGAVLAVPAAAAAKRLLNAPEHDPC